MSLKDDLIAAKALIDTPEKWIKKDYYDGRDCFCAVGACVMVTAGNKWPSTEVGPTEGRSPLVRALNAALTEVDAARCSGRAFIFNDRTDTTHADIMALFDRAIAAAGDQSRATSIATVTFPNSACSSLEWPLSGWS